MLMIHYSWFPVDGYNVISIWYSDVLTRACLRQGSHHEWWESYLGLYQTVLTKLSAYTNKRIIKILYASNSFGAHVMYAFKSDCSIIRCLCVRYNLNFVQSILGDHQYSPFCIAQDSRRYNHCSRPIRQDFVNWFRRARPVGGWTNETDRFFNRWRPIGHIKQASIPRNLQWLIANRQSLVAYQ